MDEPGDDTRNTVRGDVHGTVFQAGRTGNVNTGPVHGETVYLGDVHLHGTAERADFRDGGVLALSRKDYATAVADLSRACRAAPADAGLGFLLALALLRGHRPHRIRSTRELTAVLDCLRRAEHLPHARLLVLLVQEDRGRFWERGGRVSGEVQALVDDADPAAVRQILDHVTAPENRVWRLLEASR
ncbi:hypothetical protein AB0F15_02320 [Amycolatopsis sp. NPDC026612]|uniref:hypothetical protein n=1 Tax=Amycolatopsis sp. NPDC026612 TaxID=3155466 RepID=UPI00340E225B